MPQGAITADLIQSVHSAVERNRGIPAMLDAYGEFVDSPIGPLELQDLESVFSAILGNLSERFPQIASKKAATNARNDIGAFLSLSNNNAERVKSALAKELQSVNKTMAASISERFSRSNQEERRAIDATLRLIRRSQEDIIFRVEAGNGIENSGPEFDKFFMAVRSQSPGIKELRFQNLIVEKGIFNKLILKSKGRIDNTIWVPSFFAKENIDSLIDKAAVTSEHVLYSRLKELESQGKLDPVRQLLTQFVENQGVLPNGTEIPSELEDLVNQSESKRFVILTPLEVDDISSLLNEEQEKRRLAQRQEEERLGKAETLERERAEESKKQQDLKKRNRIEQNLPEQLVRKKSGESIYLGKTLDLDQITSALARRLPEKEIEAEVKTIGDYYIELGEIKQTGVSIVGSSGSGRSTTLRRLLDGLAEVAGESVTTRIIVIDQKGEHRGIAWKYKWPVLAFVSDVQSRQTRLPNFLLSKDEEGGTELAAGLLQEWCLSAGVSCTDQQRARVASILRAQNESATSESIAKALQADPDLALVGQKLGRNILSRMAFTRIFAETPRMDLGAGSVIFDISGRGLRDPTTKEERLISSVLILKALLDMNTENSIVVIEDVLDRFKSEALRKKVVHYVSRLREKGNTIIATSRSQLRDYVGGTSLEILHRLSGEKVVAEELSGLKMSRPVRNLATLVTFLPRGYAFTSSITTRGEQGTADVPSSAIRIEPLQFSTSIS